MASKTFPKKQAIFSVLNKEGKVFALSYKLGKSYSEEERLPFCFTLAFFSAIIANNCSNLAFKTPRSNELY